MPSRPRRQEFQVLTGIRYTPYELRVDRRSVRCRTTVGERRDSLLPTAGADTAAGGGPCSISRAAMRRTLSERSPAESISAAGVASPWRYHTRLEAAVQTLAWYAEQVYKSAAVLVHLTGSGRVDAAVNNARCSLVAGMAQGMGRPLLMLAEADYSAPLDYRDLLKCTMTLNRLSCARTRGWPRTSLRSPRPSSGERWVRTRLRLATELSSLRLGEPVAEMEEEWLEDYFLPTAAFRNVLAPTTTVFVGRRALGRRKLLRAAQVLGEDRRNLVCVIKPAGYELEGRYAFLTSTPPRRKGLPS